MSVEHLTFAVLLCYLTVALLGVLIAIAAIQTPRYFPVLTLMGFGVGTPAIGLAVIRLARILGYATNPNDPSQMVILIASILFTIYCMAHALVLVIVEARDEGRERRRLLAELARAHGEGC